MSSADHPQFGRLPFKVIASGILAEIRPGAQSVYLILCAHANDEWEARVGMRRISMLSGLQVGSVSRSVSELRAAGLIDVAEASNGAAYTYRIITCPPADRSRTSERSAVHAAVNGNEGDRSRTGERFELDTVRAPVNGQETDRSRQRNTTVRASAKNRSRQREQNRENREGTDSAGAGAPAASKRDPVWDAVVGLFAVTPQTKAEKSRIGRVVRDLKTKGAAPDDIRRRLDRYRAAWPNIEATPEALLKHWDRFAQPVGELDAEPPDADDPALEAAFVEIEGGAAR